jgi:hypothetical protein
MAFLLIIPAWLLLVSLVIALCHAARHGDRQLKSGSPRRPEDAPVARGASWPGGVLVPASCDRPWALSPRPLP